ncbi:hypothetical protein VCHE48_0444 [Vibrio cholerae HE48]|nr:hypothetical protein VCHE48_0444 [Vibrio cholerae HE48]
MRLASLPQSCFGSFAFALSLPKMIYQKFSGFKTQAVCWFPKSG